MSAFQTTHAARRLVVGPVRGPRARRVEHDGRDVGVRGERRGGVLVGVVGGDEHGLRRQRRAVVVKGHDLVQASHEGYDALLTGEPEEPSAVTARELGVHLIAAGHHATERFGVQALAAHLSERFGLDWHYLEVENPV